MSQSVKLAGKVKRKRQRKEEEYLKSEKTYKPRGSQ